ncbi:MAG: hypothetical protein ACLUOF_02165 [Ruminococcus sp.]
MKKWQSSAVAAALVFSMFTVGCGEQIDQNAGIATSAPAQRRRQRRQLRRRN